MCDKGICACNQAPDQVWDYGLGSCVAIRNASVELQNNRGWCRIMWGLLFGGRLPARRDCSVCLCRIWRFIRNLRKVFANREGRT